MIRVQAHGIATGLCEVDLCRLGARVTIRLGTPQQAFYREPRVVRLCQDHAADLSTRLEDAAAELSPEHPHG